MLELSSSTLSLSNIASAKNLNLLANEKEIFCQKLKLRIFLHFSLGYLLFSLIAREMEESAAPRLANMSQLELRLHHRQPVLAWATLFKGGRDHLKGHLINSKASL